MKIICYSCFISIILFSSCPKKTETQLFKDDVTVYFNHPVKSPASQANLEDSIIQFISLAKSSIYMAVYDFDLVSIAQQLVKKKNEGVTINVVIDNENNSGESKPVIDILNSNNIQWIDDTADGTKGTGLQHNKFIIVDNKYVLTGSTNFTQSGIHGDLENGQLINDGNSNHIVLIRSKDLAGIFYKQFMQYWGDGPGNKTDSLFGLPKADHTLEYVYTDTDRIKIGVHFAPHSKSDYKISTLKTIEDILSNAKKKIYVAQFAFSAQVLADAMKVKHKQGIEIKGIGDAGFFDRYWSEFLDITGKAKPVKEEKPGVYEVDPATGHPNNVWENPGIAIPAKLKKEDKFHHKYWIVDDIVITGSLNASANGAFGNDENIVIIFDEETASEYTAAFEYQFDEFKR